jgi:hypothetical protein
MPGVRLCRKNGNVRSLWARQLALTFGEHSAAGKRWELFGHAAQVFEVLSILDCGIQPILVALRRLSLDKRGMYMYIYTRCVGHECSQVSIQP